MGLRWLIENGIVIPIPGAKNGAQAANNAGALSFSLSEDDIAALERATRAWRNAEGSMTRRAVLLLSRRPSRSPRRRPTGR